jgi:hypothetical protein
MGPSVTTGIPTDHHLPEARADRLCTGLADVPGVGKQVRRFDATFPGFEEDAETDGGPGLNPTAPRGLASRSAR